MMVLAASVASFDTRDRHCTRLGANLFDFVRILGVQQVDLLLEMPLDVTARFHGLLRVDQIDGDTIFA